MPHARRSRRQEQAAHAGRLADAPGGDGIEDVLHGVVNGEARRHHTAWGRRKEKTLFPLKTGKLVLLLVIYSYTTKSKIQIIHVK